jgi:hypothetical protein
MSSIGGGMSLWFGVSSLDPVDRSLQGHILMVLVARLPLITKIAVS